MEKFSVPQPRPPSLGSFVKASTEALDWLFSASCRGTLLHLKQLQTLENRRPLVSHNYPQCALVGTIISVPRSPYPVSSQRERGWTAGQRSFAMTRPATWKILFAPTKLPTDLLTVQHQLNMRMWPDSLPLFVWESGYARVTV